MISPEMLRRYPHFGPISESSLARVAMISQQQVFPAGSTIFNEHDPADTLYVILDGEVSIRYVLGNGEQRTVDTLGDGDLLVWSALVEPYHTTGIGTALKDTQVLAIDARQLRELIEEDPLLGLRLMHQVAKLLANRLEGARVQLAVV